MNDDVTLKLIEKFEALDGYHCQSNSFAKIFNFYNAPLSEDMLLGIGSAVGFMYWHQKGALPFLGGRDNNKNYSLNLGERTNVVITKRTTSSVAKAQKKLIDMLNNQQPVMLFVDMGLLPYFDFGEEYHFGGHTHVVCGFDGENTVLVSDMAATDIGLKKGIVHKMSLEQLAQARGSKFKPFPPKHAYFEFDFTNFRRPTPEDIYSSLKQTVDQMLNPPIRNFGVKGIRKAGSEIEKWEKLFDKDDFRMSLFNIYLFVTVAGTGGGLFRYMYGRFLKEASQIVSNEEIDRVGNLMHELGDMWTEMALPFKDALTMENPAALTKNAYDQLNLIADKEEEAFTSLKEICFR